MLDFSSLLLAIFFSTAGISVVLFAAWATSRQDGFLLTCGLGALLVAISTVLSALYAHTPQVWLVTSAYVFLLGGLSTLHGTAWQFRHDAPPARVVIAAAAITIGLTAPPHALGYNGVGFVVGFLCAAALLFLAAFNFWTARREAPGTLISLSAFYFVMALSFLPRAALVALDGKAVMPGPPQNWAQTAGLVLIVASIPALGALTLALNQQRLVRAHRQQAFTDPLTGLPNRRALLASMAELSGEAGVAVFDIDRFKSINDTHGHACGDQVIALFAETLSRHLCPGQIAARIGGEEFVLVCPGGNLPDLRRLSDRLRHDFSERARGQLSLVITASGGLAHGDVAGERFTQTLAAADKALYRAKQLGRDRLECAEDERPDTARA
ncbi:GGDEF domain-containing protein [Xanthobacter sp. V3C-3]|uniref:GGDEF domain-containing protein n=1 Tax=Xanthobacter lutulentifluminis TaxID=3119935 RepID=UPI00372A561D